MDAAAKESARGENYTARLDPLPFSRDDAAHSVLIYQEIRHRLLHYGQTRLVPQVSCDGMLIPVSYTHLTLPTNREV